jgi:hypothetical protein
MADHRSRSAVVRELNNQFRKSPLLHGRAVVTRGVAGNGNDFVTRAMSAVEAFSDFNAENDSYGEHDFCSFDLDGETLFWDSPSSAMVGFLRHTPEADKQLATLFDPMAK